jgi:hypothetical protein
MHGLEWTRFLIVAIAFANIMVGIDATPSASLKPFVVLKRIPILKIIFGSVGCGFGAITESTSIFPPSFYTSFPLNHIQMQIHNRFVFCRA